MKIKLHFISFYLVMALMPTLGFSQIDNGAINTTVECDGSGNTTELNAWLSDNGGAVASSTCGNVTWTNDFTGLDSDSCDSIATVTFTATGDCGSASTTALFMIIDSIPPIVSSPANIAVSCIDDVPPIENLIANDNCSGNIIAPGFEAIDDSNPCDITITRTWIVSDACENATFVSQIIIVGDVIPPIITSAIDTSVLCDGSGNTTELNNWLSSNGGAIALDNCNSINWENDFTSLSSDCSETVSATVTFTVIDDCGNASETVATFTIEALNDECINAYPLIIGETIEANNYSATTSSETPNCNDNDRADVWFNFNSGTYTTLDILVNTGFVIQLWEGECGALTQVPNSCVINSLLDFPVASNTDYYVQVWSCASCRFSMPTGIFDILVQDGSLSTPNYNFETITFYPNPTRKSINISGLKTNSRISIYDISGKKLKSYKSKSVINLEDFNAGIYLLYIVENHRTEIFKIIKE